MTQFLQPSSVGLMCVAIVAAVALTGVTAFAWDRRGGWLLLRAAGPLLSCALLTLGAFIGINLITSLFQTWPEVWGYLR
ncbi:hypothetical protein [Nakamurella lactea]|uniref:hypothetical protein n=1 Tax=Nakamurella lactea TaxID=459515 RepID=UPI00040BD6DA|nr:hypothetical protein [Nakamurella lactea]